MLTARECTSFGFRDMGFRPCASNTCFNTKVKRVKLMHSFNHHQIKGDRRPLHIWHPPSRSWATTSFLLPSGRGRDGKVGRDLHLRLPCPSLGRRTNRKLRRKRKDTLYQNQLPVEAVQRNLLLILFQIEMACF